MKLPKTYQPSQYEADIYALWEKSEAFLPKQRGSKAKYSQVMPPPNANGNLHLGHATTNAIQDILTRYHRMKGEATLYLPGADHAGFETWVVYEKELNKQDKTRFDFSREDLYQQVWDFVQLNKSNFEDQLRSLGASCDWTRFRFTLDEPVVKTTYQTFQKMWRDKLIYRGERLVNFCTYHGTSFSDIEVDHQPVAGQLWHIRYPLADGSGEVIVATTRPETMLGDTAVAVHPKDSRYQPFLGKTLKLPLTQREIPIIADEMVDRDFGSGAVKITPAHDPNDYEVAQRHDLPLISVITHEGNMTHNITESYRGLSVEEARKAVVADLDQTGLLVKTEAYQHSVGHCYRCGNVIQPLLREQWFVDMKPLANRAIKALRAGDITFYPASKADQAITYLKSIRDWNISRQIAWGIPIPAFQNLEDPDDWIFDDRVDQPTIIVNGKTYRRDPDVFDTWFSSGQWPFATLEYPDGSDFKQFYPLDLMETGFDILYQWVCRMIMLGLYVTDKAPFKDVYLHGLVLDEHGKKMSKSKGNVVNPIDVIEEYGSDALRIGLITGQTAANNQPFSLARVVAGRNFCNKLWNVARYIEARVGEDYHASAKPKVQGVADDWILYKLQLAVKQVSGHLDNYRFSEASEAVYHLLWDDFADWYIEASKVSPSNAVLVYGLETILKLAHPFAPFVTETIWQTLSWTGDDNLITAPWPSRRTSSAKKAQAFEEIIKVVSEVRFVKGAMHLKGELNLYHGGEAFLGEHAGLIARLAGLESVKEVKDGHGLHLTSTSLNCWLDIDQETARHFLVKLKEKFQTTEKQIEQLEGRLNNKAYLTKAPHQLVTDSKQQLEEAKTQASKIKEEYQRYASLGQ